MKPYFSAVTSVTRRQTDYSGAGAKPHPAQRFHNIASLSMVDARASWRSESLAAALAACGGPGRSCAAHPIEFSCAMNARNRLLVHKLVMPRLTFEAGTARPRSGVAGQSAGTRSSRRPSKLKPLVYTLGAAVVVLVTTPRSFAQGCIPAHYLSLSLGAQGIEYLDANQREVDVSYRIFCLC